MSLPFVPASRPKTAEVVLYVDLDGVVQHASVLFHPARGAYMSPSEPHRKLFEWVPILLDILKPYPQVRLVLSSSWCVRPGYTRTVKKLPEELRLKFIGGTYHRRIHGRDPWTKESFMRSPRGAQVLADANRRKPKHWLALDDDVEDWPKEALENLLTVDGRFGLSDTKVQQQLSMWLGAVCDPKEQLHDCA